MENLAERAIAQYLVKLYGVEKVKQVLNNIKKERVQDDKHHEQLRVLQREVGNS